MPADRCGSLTQSGAVAQTLTGNGLTTPYAVAIDSNGNAWAANFGSTTVSAFTNGGSTLASYTVGSGPRALAFDAAGNLFVANQSSNSLTELSSSGGFVQTITTGVSSPTAVAIDPK
jgi:streptogramin lyase